VFEESSVFALINVDGNVDVRLVEMEAETQNKICFSLSETVKIMEEKQPVEFDGKYKPNGDELLMIKEFIISDSIADAIRNPLSVAMLSYSEDNEPDIKAIFVGTRQELNGFEVFTVAFQRFRKEQYLSTKRFNLFYDKNTFATEKRWGIGISYNVDCLYKTNYLQFQSYYFARQIFDLSQYYRSATDSEVDEFSSLEQLDISDKEKFVEISDTWIRRKIASINDSGVLKNYDVMTIKRLAENVGLNIKINKNKISLPTDKKELKEILAFLDEEVYKGTFSEDTYITNSKKKIE
jgi:hypothetical protein